MFLDKSQEYWAGWSLAFFQWYSNRSFYEILSVVPLPELLLMYPVFHEMDILHFTEAMTKKLQKAQPFTRLKTRREACQLSQSELAKHAGISFLLKA